MLLRVWISQPSVGLLAIRVQAYLWPGKPHMTPHEALALLQAPE